MATHIITLVYTTENDLSSEDMKHILAYGYFSGTNQMGESEILDNPISVTIISTHYYDKDILESNVYP